MLHPIDLPQCAAQLYELTELARLTLAFATQYNLTTLPQSNAPEPPYRYRKAVADATNTAEGSVNRVWANYIAFMQSKGRETAGKWLFDQYSAVAVPVVELLKIPLIQKQNPDIAQLFTDDIALLDQLAKTQNDLSAFPQFYYQSVKLDADVDKFFKEIMRNFYEKLFRNKERPIPTYVVGGTEDLNGNLLLKGYTNLHVCPGCDRGHQSIENGQLQTQNDHFFPLSHYPFFAVHPLNLTPYCVECNSLVVKGAKDVIDASHAANLSEIFHPYRPAQQYIQVSAKQMPTKMTLDINEHGHATPRMTGFLNLLNIQNRWEGEFYKLENNHQNLPRVEERIFSRLKDQINGAKLYAESLNQLFRLDAQWLSTILQNVAAKLPRDYGREPWAITTRAYAEWVKDDDVEREHLLGRLQSYLQPVTSTIHRQASQDIRLEGRRAIGDVPPLTRHN